MKFLTLRSFLVSLSHTLQSWLVSIVEVNVNFICFIIPHSRSTHYDSCICIVNFYICTRGISDLKAHSCYNDHVDPFSLQLYSASYYASIHDIVFSKIFSWKFWLESQQVRSTYECGIHFSIARGCEATQCSISSFSSFQHWKERIWTYPVTENWIFVWFNW